MIVDIPSAGLLKIAVAVFPFAAVWVHSEKFAVQSQLELPASVVRARRETRRTDLYPGRRYGTVVLRCTPDKGIGVVCTEEDGRGVILPFNARCARCADTHMHVFCSRVIAAPGR